MIMDQFKNVEIWGQIRRKPACQPTKSRQNFANRSPASPAQLRASPRAPQRCHRANVATHAIGPRHPSDAALMRRRSQPPPASHALPLGHGEAFARAYVSACPA
jgi:hypothetical protein